MKMLNCLILLSFLTACGSGGSNGADGAAGNNGKAGIDGINGQTIVSFKDLSVSADLCGSGSYCYFNGGQIVTYSDGTKIITATGTTQLIDGSDDDVDALSITLIVASSSTASYQRIMTKAYYSGAYHAAFLYYTRSPEKVEIKFDTNDNGFQTSDITAFTPNIN